MVIQVSKTKTYYYKVRAYKGSSYSAYSEPMSAVRILPAPTDVKVNNASNEDKTFRVIIATYDGTKLTAVSVGEECKAYANAQAFMKK